MMRILDVAGWSGSGAGAGTVDWEDMSAISCTFELVTILSCIIDGESFERHRYPFTGCRRLDIMLTME